MPPKAKYSKAQIVDAAFDLARRDGLDAVMARDVAEKLGTSTSPIFTAFSNMDKLKEQVVLKAEEYYEEYAAGRSDEKLPAFMKFCLQMTGFAKAEPQLFKLLFSGSAVSDDTSKLPIRGSAADQCKAMLVTDYHLPQDDADFLFDQFWIYTYGMCMLIAEGTYDIPASKLNKLLADEFKAQYVLIKSGNR